MMARAMTDGANGSGAAAEARRRRRRILLVLGFAVAGGVAGGLMGGALGDTGSLARGTVPAWVAITSAAMFVVLLAVGALVVGREFDEVEVHHRRAAAKTALYGYVLVYIPWYLLWRGALLPEPSHEMLFGLLYVLMLGGYFWNKFRA